MEKASKDEMKEIVRSILGKGYLMSLATSDGDGPWISEIVYVSDSDLNIYWISNTESRHSKALLGNPMVAGAITISDRPQQPTEAVQISGIAQMIEGEFPELARMRTEKMKFDSPIDENQLLAYNDKRYGGKHCWFKMTPIKMDILYKQRFGDDKAILEI
ncbi:MAG: pyridoxamine 5'-phosphate oxidase family protein [Candidatus Micrarchaeota archaeon]|nr:pyridoxamine 5'-phosphate oxidase family protein [Candidatus Micrarchaeota archaeon]